MGKSSIRLFMHETHFLSFMKSTGFLKCFGRTHVIGVCCFFCAYVEGDVFYSKNSWLEKALGKKTRKTRRHDFVKFPLRKYLIRGFWDMIDGSLHFENYR